MATRKKAPDRDDSLDKVALDIIDDARKSMAALTAAAQQNWKPGVASHNLDETDVFLDDEGYNELVHLAEIMTESKLMLAIGTKVFGLPEEMVNNVVADRLHMQLATPPRPKRAGHVASSKKPPQA